MKSGNFSFNQLKQGQRHNCFHGNGTTAVILFLLWCRFLVPSFKNTALIFPEIFLIECCTVLVERSMTSSLPSFAQYKNVNISKTKKDIPKRKTPFFFTLKSLSNKQILFFYFIGTLREEMCKGYMEWTKSKAVFRMLFRQ